MGWGYEWKVLMFWEFIEKSGFSGWCMKNQYNGRELPKKRGLGQFVYLRGGLGKKREWCFWKGAETPMHTMSWSNLLIDIMAYRHKIPKANNNVWH